MARTGVTYADVQRAAETILAQQGNPTVDTVREALGGTGSKSTIAPLLKRWRQQVEPVSKLESALPVQLLQSVRNLYEEMEASKQQEIAAHAEQASQHIALSQQAQVEAEQARLATAEQLLQTEQQLQQQLQEKAALEENLRQTQLLATRLDAEQQGLRLRLQDHTQENQQLHKQLEQLSQQFEHYQNASAQLRQQERLQAEQRQQTLEHELSQLRQQQLSRQEQVVLLQAELQQSRQQLQQADTALQQAVLDKTELLQQMQTAQRQHQDFVQTSQLQQLHVQQALSQAEQGLALSSQQQQELHQLIASLRDQVLDLVQERKAWNQERKDLLQMLDRYQQQHLPDQTELNESDAQ